jgi:hypothetical protein
MPAVINTVLYGLAHLSVSAETKNDSIRSHAVVLEMDAIRDKDKLFGNF